MATLLNRIEARIGDTNEMVLASSSTKEAVANLVSALPPDKAIQHATETVGSGSQGVNARGRILGVRVGNRRANIIPATRRIDVTGATNSIYGASETFPSAWSIGGVWFGFPSDQDVYVISLEVPSFTIGDSSISGMPHGTEELAVLYACFNILSERFFIEDVATLGAFPSVPSAPSAPAFTYSDAVAATIGAVSIGNLPVLGSYTQPSHSAPAEPTIAALSLPTTPDPSVVVGAPSFTQTDAMEGTIGTTTIGALPTPPTYDGPTNISTLVDSLSEGDIGTALDQTNPATWFSVLSKVIENEEDPELANQAIARINQFVQAGSIEVQNAVAEFNEGLEDYKAEVQRLLQQAQIDADRVARQAQMETETHLQNEQQALLKEIQEYQSKLEYFGQQVSIYGAEVNADVQEWTANELQAKIQYYFQQYSNSLELYMADQQNEMNKFQEHLTDFQADVQKELRQAELTLQQLASQAELDTNVAIQNEIQDLTKQVQQYQAALNRYQTELGSYSQQVQQVVAQYNAEVNEYENTQQKALAAAERYHKQYLEKLELLTLSYDGATSNRTRS